MRMPMLISCAYIALLAACGPKVDTGRNANPRSDGLDSETGGPGGGPNGQGPGGQVGPGGQDGNGGSGSGLADATCFTTETKNIPDALAKVCNEYIKPNALLGKVYDHLCVKGHMLAVMDQPACGWQGDEASIKQFMYTYEREPESSGKDYEDTHATIMHISKPAAKVIYFDRLIFEDYARFKSEGFLWISGTRESVNLNNSTLEKGLLTRSRIDKDIYELGYSGRVQLFQIDSKTWMQVLYADSDFIRVKGLEQINIFHDLPDGTSMVLKIEHKSIESKNLYNRAWKGAIDIALDIMRKSWSNANKGS